MTGRELLELAYDILARNEVAEEDRERMSDYINHIDYDNGKIVFGYDDKLEMDFRLYDHEEG